MKKPWYHGKRSYEPADVVVTRLRRLADKIERNAKPDGTLIRWKAEFWFWLPDQKGRIVMYGDLDYPMGFDE